MAASSDEPPLPFTQVPGRPSFRSTAVNAVAMVPLLSTDKNGHESDSFSQKSFVSLMKSLHDYSHKEEKTTTAKPANVTQNVKDTSGGVQDLVLVVPNSQLTRPGDWRYDNTPLKNFHWGHGCQRLLCFDGRPHCNRMAHDRLINPIVSRDWIDLYPSRRTAAVVGILNMRDCVDTEDLRRAEQELRQWAERYSAPPYEVTFHGRSFARDEVVKRLFVFDSFHDSCREIDLSPTKLKSNLVAFPPSDEEHVQMMEMHLNVVVNDLAVGIFRQLESKIRESDALCKEKGGGPDARVKTHSLLQPKATKQPQDEPVSKGGNLSVANIANVVSPANQLSSSSTNNARSSTTKNPLKSMVESAGARVVQATGRRHSPTPQLLTPLDDVWDFSELNPRDAEAMKKRDVGRREKLAADLSLLAGSPMDAYERYSRAAEMCKASPDPLWYAAALEGCAAAHISMAEAGGYNVETYLENNFQLPEEFMALATNAAFQDSRKQPTKQTLPTVVVALCEEALHVTNRHPKLAPLQAELLLKLALYVAETEESHLRCRWGEGEGCYGGDVSHPRRWDRTSVSQLTFGDLRGKDDQDLIAANTLSRCKRWTELLHRAVSVGALTEQTRADVAAACAQMCLRGLMPTQWKNRPKKERIPLPRKAAFFATVAADCISACSNATTLQGSGLWLAACQFYSRHGNTENYGWATLRASTLHALSLQEDKLSSEAAAEMLLALLCEYEMPPGHEKLVRSASLRASLKALDKSLEKDDGPIAANSKHSWDGAGDDRSDTESIVSLSSRYSSYSSKAQQRSMSFRSNFFPTHNPAVASLLTAAQAKWAEDDAIPQVQVPLTDNNNLAKTLISLRCVLPTVRLESCAWAQKRCITHISELRGDIPTISSSLEESSDPHYAFSLFGSPDKGDPIVPPPISIVSASVVPSESHLLLERCKAQGQKSESSSLGSMATFFNPYDSKNQAVQSTLVAQGEEREVTIEFANHLAVPLDVISCQLEFDHGGTDRIKAPALSFMVPPKAKRFAVNFPFIVLSQSTTEGGVESFDVTGLRVTCLSRCYFIPIGKKVQATDRQVPEPASVYQRRAQYKSNAEPQQEAKPRLEAIPAQPNLQLAFKNSQEAITNGTTVPVPLSDGEVFTLPSFCIQNDLGPSGLGTAEQLQVMGIGLPGLPDICLFDSDAPVKETSVDMEKEGSPPLGMKASYEGLSLESINEKSGKGGSVTVEITAAHDMARQLKKCDNVRIRFRYRGCVSVEIWRKLEVNLKIIRVKGPRILSLTFRPDLTWGSAYSELCASLAQRSAESEAIKRDAPDNDGDANAEPSILQCVGIEQGMHVSSDNVVFLMAVANETDSTIVLSNKRGLVGGFEGSPMPTVRITSGVSVKIPVVMPRIKRIGGEENGVTDIAAELVASTALQWKTVGHDEQQPSSMMDTGTRKVRHGRVRIPAQCLRKIIASHRSFVSNVCEPPVTVKINIGRKESEKNVVVSPGAPVDTFVQVETADWVPPEVIDKCSITLEFCAARKDDDKPRPGAFVWCGLVRRTMSLNEPEKKHRARIAFLQPGPYVVSACAKLTTTGHGAEETWWAPLAENVVVETSKAVPQ